MSQPIAILAAGFALLYWSGFCYRSQSWPKSTVKTASVLLLALAAWLADGPMPLVIALLLCALGDYLLSRDSEAQFMAGVGAFAAGHFAYVWLFVTHPAAQPGVLGQMPQAAGIVVLVVFGVAMAAILWRHAGNMRIPVMIYIPIILSMGIAVLMLPVLGPLAFALPAAVSFILSDFTLSMELFVLPESHSLRRYTPFVVWPTYWLAQLGFTLAFALFALN